MKPYLLVLIAVIFTLSCQPKFKQNDKPPNVLLIGVDDLNDWVGVLGGHPQAQTPNIDRLAARGVLFANAHCQSPVCNPSRASLMTSLYPSTSGIYFLNPDLKESPVASKSTLMPQRFKEEGYHVTGVGKLFHNGGGQNETYIPNYGGQFGGFGPMPEEKISTYPGHPLWDWGVFPERDEQMPDFKIANWAVKHLAEKHDSALWMGVGFYRPHVPQFAPQRWFDLYPLESLQLPKIAENDLQDIPPYGVDITRLEHVSPPHEWVTENEAWKPLVQSYLACVSFVDDQVGKVVEALENSEYADNTYIVLFSDHGFHMGEKERYAKRSLWEDGSRTPMIIVGPGITEGKVCHQPAQLLDIYPTLLELTGHQADPSHEGNSLVPLLQDAKAEWPHMARTSFGPGNYAIISEQYRFIQYNDGSEEFYDRAKDPHEWNNVIATAEYAEAVKKHRLYIPQERHEILGKGSTGHKSYVVSEDNRYYNINAVTDYEKLSVAGFRTPYIDKARKAIAINAVKFKGEYAAVTYTFKGESGSYNLKLKALAELDGESNYKIAINGKRLEGTRTNPLIFGKGLRDYTPANHIWEEVELSKGDIIRVESSSETNGKVPEGDITAYSRGRFTGLVFYPTAQN